MEREHFDITGYSFEEFVAFVFQHEVKTDARPLDSWHLHIEVDFDPLKVSEYYLRLFREPEFLREAYTVPQLEEGFWAIQSCAVEWSVQRLLENLDLPFSVKEACVRSMFDLFAKLFAFEPLDSAVVMWWDSLCFDLGHSNRGGENSGEGLLLSDVMFDTLSRILLLPFRHCQRAALHGLGHLHHPETPKLIEDFIANHPALSEEEKNYALAAAKFEVL